MIDQDKSRILVTGSSGFIGTNLVEALLSEGYPVLGLDEHPPKNFSQRGIWREQNLLEGAKLTETVANFAPNIIIHLGARTDLDGTSVKDYAANHEGTRYLLEAADRCASVKRVLFASTRLVNRIGYEPKGDDDYCPTTFYGESKVLGEQLVRSANAHFQWAIVRPTSIWGPWFGVPYRTFFDAVLAGRYIHPRGIRVMKSFGYVGNVVFELMALMNSSSKGVHRSTFYLADYKQIEVFTFAKQIARQASRGSILEVSKPILKMGALVGDLLKSAGWSNPPLTSFRLDNLITNMKYETANLEAVCGKLPFEHEEGIARTLAWMNSHD